MSDRTESSFGAYTLHERIGVGGMAEAYVATRDGAATPCVLKLIRDADNPIALARMRQEAHAGVHLAHDNVVRTLDAGTIDGTFYIAVELIVGEDLRRVVEWFQSRSRPVPIPLVVGVMRQTLTGLAYAHAATGPDGAPLGVVHRDLAPANLMIDHAGCVKIIDFGLVRAALGGARTSPGMLMGTLEYIAPEQAQGEAVDARADLYALSAVAYTVLTGARVARGIRPRDVVQSLLADTPRPVESLRADVSPRLARALTRGLAKAREDRHASAAAYLEALEGEAGLDADEIRAQMHEAFPELADRASRWASWLEREPTQVTTRAEVRPRDALPVATVDASTPGPSNPPSIESEALRRPRTTGASTAPPSGSESLRLPMLSVILGALAVAAVTALAFVVLRPLRAPVAPSPTTLGATPSAAPKPALVPMAEAADPPSARAAPDDGDAPRTETSPPPPRTKRPTARSTRRPNANTPPAPEGRAPERRAVTSDPVRSTDDASARTAPLTPGVSMAERISRLDSRLRRLDARAVDPEATKRLRADLAFARASGAPRPEVIDRIEQAVERLERASPP